jgi:hypothetical protein
VKYIVTIVLSLCTSPLLADTADDLSNFVGYTIVGSFTVTGWQDRNGKKGDSFEGCEYDRIIILDDSKTLRCATYSYSYSYRPRAVVLTNGTSFKMIVGSDTYDMRR